MAATKAKVVPDFTAAMERRLIPAVNGRGDQAEINHVIQDTRGPSWRRIARKQRSCWTSPDWDRHWHRHWHAFRNDYDHQHSCSPRKHDSPSPRKHDPVRDRVNAGREDGEVLSSRPGQEEWRWQRFQMLAG